MPVFRVTELVGTSKVSYAEATTEAIARAKKTLRNVDWFEVKEMRGAIHGDEIEYQIKLEVGFRLED